MKKILAAFTLLLGFLFLMVCLTFPAYIPAWGGSFSAGLAVTGILIGIVVVLVGITLAIAWAVGELDL